MIKQQIIDRFRQSIQQLIPSTRVTPVACGDQAGTPCGLEPDQMAAPNGAAVFDLHTVVIWSIDILEQKIFFHIQRLGGAFSSEEIRMLQTIPLLPRNLKNIHSDEFLGFSLKFSSRISFGDLVVAKYLEKDPERRCGIPSACCWSCKS